MANFFIKDAYSEPVCLSGSAHLCELEMKAGCPTEMCLMCEAYDASDGEAWAGVLAFNCGSSIWTQQFQGTIQFATWRSPCSRLVLSPCRRSWRKIVEAIQFVLVVVGWQGVQRNHRCKHSSRNLHGPRELRILHLRS